ncbi:carbohydrate-binding module family 1 protein [Botryobasidium botryosum FD-172 SS1]|uniref:AA9 family lytic polysaccharide monooxygenase n=1 Tax=Botryobasidium botryosum (strain FD-172 SS1) TaxID=930990 RepID=A0A067LX50_BOTB1|nr:carbohydrate-binding module family 1 protein [Botryobasidium botryosum FD-172 SS1]
MLTSTLLSVLLAAASSVQAHSTFQELWVAGSDKAGSCMRTVASNSPVTSPTSADIACNVNGNKAAASKCTVAAGQTVTVEMHAQPGDRSCSNEAIGGNHDGPVIVYLAKVPDSSTAQGSSVGWFKIGQAGLISKDYWGTDLLNANCGKYDVKIPSDIVAGDYLLRAEVIALHVAGSVGGAQFYPGCFQLTVTGGGNASPPTVRFPGAYSANDPGILFNLYGSYTTYTVPGPAVYTGGGPAAPTTSPGSPSPTTTTTTSRPTTTAPTGPAAPHYGQCGGIGWTGPTFCEGNYTCTKSNDYYSQCL